MSKFDYVRAAEGDEFQRHHCHWPDCDRAVPPAMWGCKFHWFKLPMRLRNRIWATYKPGQEISKTPSAEYLAVAQEAQAWIAASADTRPKGGDAKQTPFTSGAVLSESEADAQPTVPPSEREGE